MKRNGSSLLGLMLLPLLLASFWLWHQHHQRQTVQAGLALVAQARELQEQNQWQEASQVLAQAQAKLTQPQVELQRVQFRQALHEQAYLRAFQMGRSDPQMQVQLDQLRPSLVKQRLAEIETARRRKDFPRALKRCGELHQLLEVAQAPAQERVAQLILQAQLEEHFKMRADARDSLQLALRLQPGNLQVRRLLAAWPAPVQPQPFRQLTFPTKDPYSRFNQGQPMAMPVRQPAYRPAPVAPPPAQQVVLPGPSYPQARRPEPTQP